MSECTIRVRVGSSSEYAYEGTSLEDAFAAINACDETTLANETFTVTFDGELTEALMVDQNLKAANIVFDVAEGKTATLSGGVLVGAQNTGVWCKNVTFQNLGFAIDGLDTRFEFTDTQAGSVVNIVDCTFDGPGVVNSDFSVQDGNNGGSLLSSPFKQGSKFYEDIRSNKYTYGDINVTGCTFRDGNLNFVNMKHGMEFTGCTFENAPVTLLGGNDGYKFVFDDCDFTYDMNSDAIADDVYSMYLVSFSENARAAEFVNGCTFAMTGTAKEGVETSYIISQAPNNSSQPAFTSNVTVKDSTFEAAPADVTLFTTHSPADTPNTNFTDPAEVVFSTFTAEDIEVDGEDDLSVIFAGVANATATEKDTEGTTTAVLTDNTASSMAKVTVSSTGEMALVEATGDDAVKLATNYISSSVATDAVALVIAKDGSITAFADYDSAKAAIGADTEKVVIVGDINADGVFDNLIEAGEDFAYWNGPSPVENTFAVEVNGAVNATIAAVVNNNTVEVSETGSLNANEHITVFGDNGELIIDGDADGSVRNPEKQLAVSQLRVAFGGSADIRDTLIEVRAITVGADAWDDTGYSSTLTLTNTTVEYHGFGDGSQLNINVKEGNTLSIADSEFVKKYTSSTIAVVNNGTFELSGTVLEAVSVTNNGTFKVAGESTLNITSATGNAVVLTDGAALTDSKLFSADYTAGSAELLVAGNASINGTYEGNLIRVSGDNAKLTINGVCTLLAGGGYGQLTVGGSTTDWHMDKYYTGTYTVGGELLVSENARVDVDCLNIIANGNASISGVVTVGSQFELSNGNITDAKAGAMTVESTGSLNIGPYSSISGELTVKGTLSDKGTHKDLYDYGQLTVNDGAFLNVEGGTIDYQNVKIVNNGTIGVDTDSSVTAKSITGTGDLVVELTNDEITNGVHKKIVDVTNGSLFDSISVVDGDGYAVDGFGAFIAGDGDIWVSDADMSTIYVDSSFSGDFGADLDDGKYFGVNAFADYESAREAVVAGTTEKVVIAGNVEQTGHMVNMVAEPNYDRPAAEGTFAVDVDAAWSTTSGAMVVNNNTVKVNESGSVSVTQHLTVIGEDGELIVQGNEAEEAQITAINNFRVAFGGSIDVADTTIHVNKIDVGGHGVASYVQDELKNSATSSITLDNVNVQYSGIRTDVYGDKSVIYYICDMNVYDGCEFTVTDSTFEKVDHGQSSHGDFFNLTIAGTADLSGTSLELDTLAIGNYFRYFDLEKGDYNLTIAQNEGENTASSWTGVSTLTHFNTLANGTYTCMITGAATIVDNAYEVVNGTLSLDYTSSVTFNTLNAAAETITIDTDGFTEGAYRILNAGTETVDYAKYITTDLDAMFGTDDKGKFVIANNDLYITDKDQSTLYVDASFTEESALEQGLILNYNAFTTLQGAVEAAPNNGLIEISDSEKSIDAIGIDVNKELTLSGKGTFFRNKGNVIIGYNNGDGKLTIAEGSELDFTNNGTEIGNCNGFVVSDAKADGTTGHGELYIDNAFVKTGYLYNRNSVTVVGDNKAFSDTANLEINGGLYIVSRDTVAATLEVKEKGYLKVIGSDLFQIGNSSGNVGKLIVNDAKVESTKNVTIYEDSFVEVTDGEFIATAVTNNGTFTVSSTEGKSSTLNIGTLTGTIYATGTIADSTIGGGTIFADGDLTFVGDNSFGTLNMGWYNNKITIGQGASVATSDARSTFSYGNTLDIDGTIVDAKAAKKEELTASLTVNGGFSFNGNGTANGKNATMDVDNAYVVFGSSSSKNSGATGNFEFDFNNSIVDIDTQLMFAASTVEGLNPYFTLKGTNSVFNINGKLNISHANTTAVFDNSDIIVSNRFKNVGSFTLQNGSTMTVGKNDDGPGFANIGNSGTLTVTGAGTEFDMVDATTGSYGFTNLAGGSVNVNAEAAFKVSKFDNFEGAAINVSGGKFSATAVTNNDTIAVTNGTFTADSVTNTAGTFTVSSTEGNSSTLKIGSFTGNAIKLLDGTTLSGSSIEGGDGYTSVETNGYKFVLSVNGDEAGTVNFAGENTIQNLDAGAGDIVNVTDTLHFVSGSDGFKLGNGATWNFEDAAVDGAWYLSLDGAYMTDDENAPVSTLNAKNSTFALNQISAKGVKTGTEIGYGKFNVNFDGSIVTLANRFQIQEQETAAINFKFTNKSEVSALHFSNLSSKAVVTFNNSEATFDQNFGNIGTVNVENNAVLTAKYGTSGSGMTDNDGAYVEKPNGNTGTINVTNATMILEQVGNNAFANSGEIYLTGGTIRVVGSVANSDTIEVLGGKFTASGSVTNNDTFTVNGGVIEVGKFVHNSSMDATFDNVELDVTDLDTGNGAYVIVGGSSKVNIDNVYGDNALRLGKDAVITHGSNISGSVSARALGNLTIGEKATDVVSIHRLDTRYIDGDTVTVNGTLNMDGYCLGMVGRLNDEALTLTGAGTINLKQNVFFEGYLDADGNYVEGNLGNIVVDKDVTINMVENDLQSHLRFTYADVTVKGQIINAGSDLDRTLLTSATVTVTGVGAKLDLAEYLWIGYYDAYDSSTDEGKSGYKSTLNVEDGGSVNVGGELRINKDSVVRVDGGSFVVANNVQMYDGASFVVAGVSDVSGIFNGAITADGAVTLSSANGLTMADLIDGDVTYGAGTFTIGSITAAGTVDVSADTTMIIESADLTGALVFDEAAEITVNKISYSGSLSRSGTVIAEGVDTLGKFLFDWNSAEAGAEEISFTDGVATLNPSKNSTITFEFKDGVLTGYEETDEFNHGTETAETLETLDGAYYYGGDKTEGNVIAIGNTSHTTDVVLSDNDGNSRVIGGDLIVGDSYVAGSAASSEVIVDGAGGIGKGVFGGSRLDGDAQYSNKTDSTVTIETTGTAAEFSGTVAGSHVVANGQVNTAAGSQSTVNINTEATFNGNIVGGMLAGTGDNSHTGTTNVNIAGASTFEGNVYGGSVVQTEANITQYGDANVTISGGTFNDRIYGGHGASKSSVGKTTLYGDTNVTLSGGTFNGNIFAGSYGEGVVNGSTNVTLSGTADINKILNGDSSSGKTSYVTGNRTLIFNGFEGDSEGNGNFDATAIRNFDVIEFSGDSDVVLENANALELEQDMSWYFEDGSSLSGFASLDLDDTAMSLGGVADGLADGSRWDIMSGDEITGLDGLDSVRVMLGEGDYVKLTYADGIWSGVNGDDNYKLSINEEDGKDKLTFVVEKI